MTTRGLAYVVLLVIAVFVLTRDTTPPEDAETRVLPVDFSPLREEKSA